MQAEKADSGKFKAPMVGEVALSLLCGNSSVSVERQKHLGLKSFRENMGIEEK